MTRTILLTATASLALAASGAHAQATGSPPTGAATEAPKESTQGPQSTADVAGPGLADIVVTAQRRSENLQNAPATINAISAGALDRAGVTTTRDLTKLVPGVNVTVVGGTQNQIRIRGVGTPIFNAFSDPAVAFSVDQVFQARPTGADGVFYDLERVEVLKGPQGTLYGRNATSGAVNVITRKPQLGKIEGFGEIEVGNYGELRTDGALNLPLGDKVAFRGAFQTNYHSGYLSNGYDDARSVAGRVSLLAQPTSTLKVLLTADYFHDSARSGYGDVPITATGGFANPANPWQAPPAGDPRNPADQTRCVGTALYTAFPFCVPSDAKANSTNWGVSATIDWALGSATLTVIPAYRDTHPQYVAYPRAVYQNIDQEAKQKTVEARLASNGNGRLKWLVGGFYFKEDQLALQNFISYNRYPHPPYIFGPQISDVSLTDESWAVFTQETFSITPQLRLTGGVRYTWEQKTKTGSFIVPTSPAQCAGPGGVYAAQGTMFTPQGCSIPELGNLTNKDVTFRAAIDYDLAPHHLVYASVNTGTHAGGFYFGLAPNTYRPEKITAYSLGSKNQFIDNRLRVNVEGFYWNYTDLQISNAGTITPPVTYGFVTVNAGNSHVYGVDTEVEFQVTPRDRLFGNLEYLRTKTQNLIFPTISPPPRGSICTFTGVAPAITQNCSGSQFILAPRWSANLGLEHSFPLDSGAKILAAVQTHIESKSFLSSDNVSTQQKDAYSQTDLNLTFAAAGDRFTLTAFVRNVENTGVKSSLALSTITSTPWVTLLPPRTFGGRVRFNF